MISLKKMFLYTCMLTMLGVFLAPTVIKPMQKQKPLVIGLDGDLGNVANFQQVLAGELRNVGINPVFVRADQPADVYLHLSSKSYAPLIDDKGLRRTMENLAKRATTHSAIYIHLVSSMNIKTYYSSFGEKKIKEHDATFQSGIFLGSFIPSEQRDDVYFAMSSGMLKNDDSTYRSQMDQLVNLLIKVNQEVQAKAGMQWGPRRGPGPKPQQPKPQPKFEPKFEQKPAPQTGPTQVRSRFAPSGKMTLVSGGLVVPSLVIPSVIAPMPRPSQPQPPQFIPQFQAPKPTQFIPPRGSQPKPQPKQPRRTASTQKPLHICILGNLQQVKNLPNVLGQELISRGLNPVFVRPDQQVDVYLYLDGNSTYLIDGVKYLREKMKDLAKHSTTGSAIYVYLVSMMYKDDYARNTKKIREQEYNQDSKSPYDEFQSGIFLGDWLSQKFDDVFLLRDSGLLYTKGDIYRKQMNELIQLLLKVNQAVQRK